MPSLYSLGLKLMILPRLGLTVLVSKQQNFSYFSKVYTKEQNVNKYSSMLELS